MRNREKKLYIFYPIGHLNLQCTGKHLMTVNLTNYTFPCDFIIIIQFIAQTVVEMLNHDFAHIKACLDIFQNRYKC